MKRSMKKLGTSVATAGLLAAGGVTLAAPAQAATVSSYIIASSTLSGCQTALRGDIKDLQVQGIYKTSTACSKVSTGSIAYQAQVWYYVK